jgi:hypothetical protein
MVGYPPILSGGTRETTMDPLAVLAAFQTQPWLALLPAVVFAALGWISRLLLPMMVAALWLLYAGYEAAMMARILCSGECNIRVDLLLVWPLLLIPSAFALGAFAWWAIRRPTRAT